MSEQQQQQQQTDNTSSDLNPHKELLAEAAAQIRADAQAREQAKPKNVGQGTLGLVGDSLGGAAIGAAAVVMGPVQGYKQSGPKGIIGGALGGLAVGVATTTIGIGSGIAKFAHGASKTAESLNPKKVNPALVITEADRPAAGAYKKHRDALYKDLNDQYAADTANPTQDSLAPPVDNKLYHVLGVDVNASPAQIRKAYYRLAQQYHPDKNPDDAEATAKFQEISDAYQILSDPVKREEYHRLGETATTGEAMMDPKALFALMFSDFEHLVGDLATSTILSTMGAGEGDPSAASQEAVEARRRKKEQFQAMREAHLVNLLNRRLEAWMAGDEYSFIAHAKHEVFALREEPFGRDLLKTVSYVYRKKASKLLDSKKGPFTGVQNFFDDLGEKAHSFRSQVRALEGGVKAMSAASVGTENESIDETARREAVTTVGAVWLASVIDIEHTLKGVLDKVLGDNRSDPAIIRKAQGIFTLGTIFEQAAHQEPSESVVPS